MPVMPISIDSWMLSRGKIRKRPHLTPNELTLTFKLTVNFRTVDLNQVNCCKSGIFDIAIHDSVGVRAFSMTHDQNCNSFSNLDGGPQQLYLGQFLISSEVTTG